MIKVLSTVGVVAALVLVAASAFMNFEYVTSWGKDALNGHILGAVSVAFDIIKALLPFFILWAWKNRRILHVTIGTTLFIGLAGFSLLSALGFAASNRNATTVTKTDLSTQFIEIGARIEGKRTLLDKQPQARAVAVVAQSINAKKQHRRFTSSKSCTDATAKKSRIFCAEYFSLKAEHAAAVERAKLHTAIDTLTASRNQLRGQGATKQADPQAGLIAKLTGLKIADTQTALVVFIAVLVELAAAFGLYLSTAHGGFQEAPKRKTKKAKPAAQKQKAALIPFKPSQPLKTKPIELCPLEELKRQNLQIVVSS